MQRALSGQSQAGQSQAGQSQAGQSQAGQSQGMLGVAGQLSRQPLAAQPSQVMGQEQATHQEQAAYKQVVNNAYSILYDKKMFPRIKQRIQLSVDEGKPVEGLASVVSMVIGQVTNSAQENRIPLTDEVVTHATVEVIEDLSDTMQKAHIHDFNQEEMAGVLFRFMDSYRDIKRQRGDLNTEEYHADFAQVQQANADGRLDRIPGLAGLFGPGKDGRSVPQGGGV